MSAFTPDPAPDPLTLVPPGAWRVEEVDGRPEVVMSREAVEVLILHSPLGEVEARRRLREATGLEW